MGGTVVILGFLPWLDKSPVKSIRYRPGWHKLVYAIFMINFVILGIIGTKAPSPVLNIVSQVGTIVYLAFFFLCQFGAVWVHLNKFLSV